MMLARSVGRPRASLEERTLSWDEVQQALRSAFFSGEEPDTGQSGAERLSPVAAAHRILTNSFGLIPFGLYRKEGEERVAVDTPELIRVLKIRPNDYMSPFMLRKVVMSNAFWHGFGAVWNRQGPAAGWSSASPCPATAAPSERTGRRGDTGMTTTWTECGGPLPTMSCPSSTLRPMTASGAGDCWTWPGSPSPWTP